jgi:hypothetical protein
MSDDNAQRIARANRAQMAWDEFIGPVLDEIDATYVARIRDISTTEFSYKARSDKQTALSTALVISQAIRSGLLEAIRDGDVARQDKLRADKIEGMSAPKRRLLGVAPF